MNRTSPPPPTPRRGRSSARRAANAAAVPALLLAVAAGGALASPGPSELSKVRHEGGATPAQQPAPEGGARRPNVVLLFADDLGYGDLGSFGHPTIRTPHLDALAQRGVRLTSFYSAPSCVPARSQLLLGRYPPRTGIRGTSVGGAGGIPEEETTLAEALRGAGYATAMIGKWHLGYAEQRHLPTSQGFDSWFGLPYSNDMIRPWVQTDEPLRLFEGTADTGSVRIPGEVDQTTLTTRYTGHAVEFIRAQAGRPAPQPFFLYLAYSMPHLPIFTAPQFRGQSKAGHYGDVIETIDWSVGRIVAALRELGLERNTLVVFTSDNGPWQNLPARMLQQGNEPSHVGSSGPLRGAKATTYEGGVRVPFVASWPGTLAEGMTSAETAATVDVFRTVVGIAGVDASGLLLDGFDLLPFLRGAQESSPRSEQLYFWGNTLVGLRVGPWKLHTAAHIRDGRWRGNDLLEVFHLDRDPGETTNVARDETWIVDRLLRRMSVLAQQMGADLPELPFFEALP